MRIGVLGSSGGSGRTALVTGSTSGIGRALAESLAAAGATVGIVARELAQGAYIMPPFNKVELAIRVIEVL